MTNSVLCIAHPGHELRVLHWLRQARPEVLILTDGSGSRESSRLESSRALIGEVGGRPGRIFGRFPDRELYDVLRRQDLAGVLSLAGEVLATLEETGADTIVGDMREGFSTSHDLCRMLIQAAVLRYNRGREKPVENYEFVLDRMAHFMKVRQPARVLQLTEAETQDKWGCARRWFPMLLPEIEHAVAKYGEQVVASEMLYAAPAGVDDTWTEEEPPFYETFGRQQIAAGLYDSLITHDEHMRPIARALQEWAARA